MGEVKVTPPPKRSLNVTPPNDRMAKSYKDVAQDSLKLVIIGADGVTLTS